MFLFKTGIAALDVIVVRKILLNSSMRVAVFSSLNGTAT